MDIHNIGLNAENEACTFLEKKGFILLTRNYRCQLGEIDLIMRDQEDIVFIEVRKRTHSNFMNAIESVTRAKQRKLIKTAMHYLHKQQWFDKVPCRFDIVGMTDNQIEWLKNAFSVENF